MNMIESLKRVCNFSSLDMLLLITRILFMELSVRCENQEYYHIDKIHQKCSGSQLEVK